MKDKNKKNNNKMLNKILLIVHVILIILLICTVIYNIIHGDFDWTNIFVIVALAFNIPSLIKSINNK